MRDFLAGMLLAAIFFASGPAFAGPKELTLSDCINIAIAQNPDIHALAAGVRIQDALVRESASGLNPNLSAFYNWTRELNPKGIPIHTSTGIGTFQSQPILINVYKDGLILQQLIFDGEKTRSILRQAEAQRDAETAAYRLLIETITFNTTKAFYQLVADRKLVAVAEEDLKNSEAHLDLAKASYKAGVAARADVIFAEVPVATARLNLTQARGAEQQGEAQLNRLLSFDVNTTLLLKDELKETPFPVTLEQASGEALKDREEIKQAQSLVKSARAQLDAAKGLYYPVVTAFATYGYTDYGPNALPGNLGYTYGLQATFNILTGGLRGGEVDQAKATLDQNSAQLESTKQNVLLDVKNAYLALRSAEESVNDANVELAQANENLRLVEGQYKVGVAPILNLLDAEVTKIQAEQHLINALANDQIAIGRLKLSMGAGR